MATSADFQETVSIFFFLKRFSMLRSLSSEEKKRETTDTARVLKGLLYPCSSCSHCWWSRKKTRRSHGKSGGRRREKKLSRDSRRIPLFNHGINKRCWRLSYKNRDKTRNCGRNTKLMGISPDVTLSQSASVLFSSLDCIPPLVFKWLSVVLPLGSLSLFKAGWRSSIRFSCLRSIVFPSLPLGMFVMTRGLSRLSLHWTL